MFFHIEVLKTDRRTKWVRIWSSHLKRSPRGLRQPARGSSFRASAPERSAARSRPAATRPPPGQRFGISADL